MKRKAGAMQHSPRCNERSTVEPKERERLRYWFHLEPMDAPQWWDRIGDARINIHIHIATSGAIEVLIERGEYGPQRGQP